MTIMHAEVIEEDPLHLEEYDYLLPTIWTHTALPFRDKEIDMCIFLLIVS